MELNIVTVLIRSVLAVLCGGIIGYERNRMGADAGMRTHSLVAVGSMLAMMTGVFAVTHYSGDVSRIGAQVISGIGFLGAGTIMVKRNNHISGLTTAAGLWVSACIGLAIGTGFYEGAIVSTIVVYFIQRELRRFSKKYARKKSSGTLHNEESLHHEESMHHEESIHHKEALHHEETLRLEDKNQTTS